MPLSISLSREQFRYGSSIFPVITTSGYASGHGVLKMGEIRYYPNLPVEAFTLPLPNKSHAPLTLCIREVEFPTWVTDANIASSGGGRNVLRTSGSGYAGAYVNTALDGDKCSVEGTTPAVAGLCGISLQNGGATILHDYTDPDVIHSVTFKPNGVGEIRELGELVAQGAYFQYESSDKILLELTDGVLKYYLVKQDTFELVLLRSTRSKLTEDPKLEVMCHDNGSGFGGLGYTQTDEATADIEIVASLENFQDWNNEYFIASTADAIMMANNEPQFTFPNPKKRLRSLNANLATRNKEFRLEYEDFFNWHGMEKEFLFIDKAKTDANDLPVEWWARFGSPFGDRSRNSCLSAHSAQIIESYRRDYVPIEIDDDEPELVFSDEWASTITGNQYLFCAYTEPLGGLLKTAQLYMNGDPVGDEVVIDPIYVDYNAPEFGAYFDTTAYPNGGYSWYWKGTDYAGNVGQSNTLLLSIAN